MRAVVSFHFPTLDVSVHVWWCCALPRSFGGVVTKWQNEPFKAKIGFANDSITTQVRVDCRVLLQSLLPAAAPPPLLVPRSCQRCSSICTMWTRATCPLLCSAIR